MGGKTFKKKHGVLPRMSSEVAQKAESLVLSALEAQGVLVARVLSPVDKTTHGDIDVVYHYAAENGNCKEYLISSLEAAGFSVIDTHLAGSLLHALASHPDVPCRFQVDFLKTEDADLLKFHAMWHAYGGVGHIGGCVAAGTGLTLAPHGLFIRDPRDKHAVLLTSNPEKALVYLGLLQEDVQALSAPGLTGDQVMQCYLRAQNPAFQHYAERAVSKTLEGKDATGKERKLVIRDKQQAKNKGREQPGYRPQQQVAALHFGRAEEWEQARACLDREELLASEYSKGNYLLKVALRRADPELFGLEAMKLKRGGAFRGKLFGSMMIAMRAICGPTHEEGFVARVRAGVEAAEGKGGVVNPVEENDVAKAAAVPQDSSAQQEEAAAEPFAGGGSKAQAAARERGQLLQRYLDARRKAAAAEGPEEPVDPALVALEKQLAALRPQLVALLTPPESSPR